MEFWFYTWALVHLGIAYHCWDDKPDWWPGKLDA